MIKKYIEYLKDNPKKYWFRRKLFGWGWVPATWQGWLALAIFILYVIWLSFDIEEVDESNTLKIAIFLVKVLSAVVILLLICFWKGEKPRWQWGFPKKDEDQ